MVLPSPVVPCKRRMTVRREALIFEEIPIHVYGTPTPPPRSLLVISRCGIGASPDMMLLPEGEAYISNGEKVTGGFEGDSDEEDVSDAVNIDGIFGIYEMLAGPYVAVMMDSASVVNDDLSGIELCRVGRIGLIPLFAPPGETGVGSQLSPEMELEDSRLYDLLEATLSTHGFFFSYKYDVTTTLQKSREAASTPSMWLRPKWAHADERFFWNKRLVTGLISAGADSWVCPVMSGHVEVARFPRSLKNPEWGRCTVMLIARRSCRRQGCRFLRRGAGAQGTAVANFVETEQIAIFSDSDSREVYSHVQVRGSIPLHWTSSASGEVMLQGDIEKSSKVCQEHIQEMESLYGSVLLLNLLEKKGGQGKLGAAYQTAAKEVTQGTDSDHLWFDMYGECANGWQEGLKSLLTKALPHHQKAGCFRLAKDSSIIARQKGVIRSSCLDCCDRTAVAQCLMSRFALAEALVNQARVKGYGSPDRSTGRLSPERVTDNRAEEIALAPLPEPLEAMYVAAWRKCGDALSKQYTGSGAQKVDLLYGGGTRTWRGIAGDALRSAKRYVINHFFDGRRQDGIDLLLGNYRPSTSRSLISTDINMNTQPASVNLTPESDTHTLPPAVPLSGSTTSSNEKDSGTMSTSSTSGTMSTSSTLSKVATVGTLTAVASILDVSLGVVGLGLGLAVLRASDTLKWHIGAQCILCPEESNKQQG